VAATTLGFEDIVRAAVKEELSKSAGGASSTGGVFGLDAKTILQILKEVQKLAELRQAQQPAAQPARALPSTPAADTVDLYPRVIAGLKQIQATLGDLRVSELIALAESDPDTTRALLKAAM
jgi:hypothetical protein